MQATFFKHNTVQAFTGRYSSAVSYFWVTFHMTLNGFWSQVVCHCERFVGLFATKRQQTSQYVAAI